MKPKKRQKLCYNCEGEVDLDVIVCPLCAADLRVERPVQERPAPVQQRETIQIPPQEEAVPKAIWPAFLFGVGSQLLVLGFLLAFFSRNGTVTLHWDARLWFLYLFASVPFLVFGYRALSKL